MIIKHQHPIIMTPFGFDVIIEHHVYGDIPYSITPDDPMYSAVKSGEFGDITPIAGYLIENGELVPTDETLDLIENERQRSEAAQQKLAGEMYSDTGVIVPFTSQDAVGLLQIKAAFEMGATSTVMHFSNGQKLPLTPETFPAFAVWFTQKRNSFYFD